MAIRTSVRVSALYKRCCQHILITMNLKVRFWIECSFVRWAAWYIFTSQPRRNSRHDQSVQNSVECPLTISPLAAASVMKSIWFSKTYSYCSAGGLRSLGPPFLRALRIWSPSQFSCSFQGAESSSSGSLRKTCQWLHTPSFEHVSCHYTSMVIDIMPQLLLYCPSVRHAMNAPNLNTFMLQQGMKAGYVGAMCITCQSYIVCFR